jgi:hypothetical protein
MYSCTCNDFTFKFKICKHIHYILMWKVQPQSILCDENNGNQLSENSVEHTDRFVTALATQAENKKLRSDLQNKVMTHF